MFLAYNEELDLEDGDDWNAPLLAHRELAAACSPFLISLAKWCEKWTKMNKETDFYLPRY